MTPEPAEQPGMSELADRVDDVTRRADENDVYRGRRAVNVKRQMWFIMLGCLVGMVLVAWRGEMNDRAIQDSRFLACQARYDQLVQFNSTRVGVGEAIIALSPNAPEEAKAAMRQGMLDSRILPLPTCQPRS